MAITGSPSRLYLMQVATYDNGPMPCYLIQTSTGANILIDSGLADDAQVPEGGPALVMGPNVIKQLAMLGLQPSDITMLICSHFDIDHAGHHAAFTNAEFIVQRAHYTAAQIDGRFEGTRAQWSHASLRYRLLDGDTELLPGLKLIETSGHVIGHQSVLITLPATGSILLAIDAVDPESFVADSPTAPRDSDQDSEAARRSTLKLLDLVQQENVALVIFGHDGPQWQELKKLPEYYE